MTKIKENPSLTTVRAILTTRWGSKGYRPHTVKAIETYYVDTALDNDSDVWNIEIGDPNGDMLDMLRRDNEVRVQLYGYSKKGSEPIMTGIADEITFTEEGRWSITGRDLSSLAVDSTVPPQFFRQAKAYSLVRRQALALGFSNTNLATGLGGQVIVKKVQHTDGSESYWEFWYRLYRKEKMWLWTEPDGTLVGANLNYSGNPFYYFGIPRATDSKSVRQQFIPIEHISISKGTQKRSEEVWVYWHRGDNGKITKANDPGMKDWIKKPLKIMQDTDARTATSARKTALEEIFESKVGEIEYTITVPDPGYEIHQNRIAKVNVPEIGLDTDMFVVGIRRQGGTDGVVLEVRLRERHYAITSRVPKDPVIKRNLPGSTTVTTELGDALPGIANMPAAWGPFFMKAARTWSGAWDFDLFLAVLLGIADQETGGSFIMERRNGGPGGDHVPWYPWRSSGSESPNRPAAKVDVHNRTLEEWKTVFANEPGEQNGSNYVSESYAVGTMQLLSMGYKHYADNLQKQGNYDQWWGGRWNAEYNIMGGGYALRDKLNTTGADPGNDTTIWIGVAAYGEGASYAQSVKSKVVSPDGYLKQVKDARAQAAADAKLTQDPGGDPGTGSYNNSPADLKTLTHLHLENSSVDIVHVDWTLLFRLNAYAKAYNKQITINDGFRTYAQQLYYWNRYKNSGFQDRYIAADPTTTTGNHQKGEACDCDIFPPATGAPLGNPAMGWEPRLQLVKFKIHPSVLWGPKKTDAVHMTRIEIEG